MDRNQRYPYNILIFNISDDDLHKQRDHIGALNENIKIGHGSDSTFSGWPIQKDDTVIVTSDHGFMELDPGYAIVVKESNKWQRYIDGGEHPVHFRFIRSDDPAENLPNEHVLGFEWKIPDGKFAVAIGRHWFQREDQRILFDMIMAAFRLPKWLFQVLSCRPSERRKSICGLKGCQNELQWKKGNRSLSTVKS